jgi:hypothetical protein
MAESPSSSAAAAQAVGELRSGWRIETLRCLHAGPEPLPAILLTCDVMPELEARAGAAGAQIMHKPVRPGVLQRCMLELLAAGEKPSECFHT